MTDKAVDEVQGTRPAVERVKVWEHGMTNNPCERQARKVYTPPQKLPDPCRSCGSDTWKDGGYADRLKNAEKKVIREIAPRKDPI